MKVVQIIASYKLESFQQQQQKTHEKQKRRWRNEKQKLNAKYITIEFEW